MRLTHYPLAALILIFLLLFTADYAHAGCYTAIAQCLHVKDGEKTIKYNDLCKSTTCGNVHDSFNHLEFLDGSTLRIDYTKDGKNLEKPEANGVPSTDIISGKVLAIRTDEGDVYIALPCEDKCVAINPDSYNKLQSLDDGWP